MQLFGLDLSGLLIPGILVLWLLLSAFVLPKLGVPT
jgi:hypothetical protein